MMLVAKQIKRKQTMLKIFIVTSEIEKSTDDAIKCISIQGFVYTEKETIQLEWLFVSIQKKKKEKGEQKDYKMHWHNLMLPSSFYRRLCCSLFDSIVFDFNFKKKNIQLINLNEFKCKVFFFYQFHFAVI